MFCTHCGSDLRQNAKFCEKCGSTVSKQKAKNQKVEKSQSKMKWLVGLIALVVVGVVFSRFFLGGNSVTGYSQDEAGFKKALDRQYQLLESGTEADVQQIYQDFLDPKAKVMSEEEYLKGFKQYWGDKHQKVIMHSYKADGANAYADRTIRVCSDENCQNVESTSRAFKKYYYENGRWLMKGEDFYCPRTTNYEMEPEFSRALSLIEQRATEADADSAETFKTYVEVIHCLQIRYATTDADMNQAEGVFHFIPGQSAETLSIVVSPRYKSKDDILTATLIMHEFTHAVNYVSGLYDGKHTDCYLDEAQAFSNQNWFLTVLNNEEKQSLLARMRVGGSPELVGIANVLQTVPRMKGATYEEQALNFVKANPFYQKQCGS